VNSKSLLPNVVTQDISSFSNEPATDKPLRRGSLHTYAMVRRGALSIFYVKLRLRSGKVLEISEYARSKNVAVDQALQYIRALGFLGDATYKPRVRDAYE
jgi:hypothetical protein